MASIKAKKSEMIVTTTKTEINAFLICSLIGKMAG